jgi:hypothetical protein
MQDLLIPPGSTLQELAGKDAAQIEGLTKAAAEARAAAVAAIAGSSSSSTGSSSGGRSAGAATAVAAGGCEIEPAVDSPSGEAPGGWVGRQQRGRLCVCVCVCAEGQGA